MPSFLDRVRNVFAPQPDQKKSAPVVMYQGMGQGYSSKQKYEDFAKEGYTQNSVVYRCVNEIAQGAASVPFKIFDGDELIENHPLLALLDRPNPIMNRVEYFQMIYSQLVLGGNSFAVKTMAGGRATELHCLRPDRVRIKAGQTMIPEAYEYYINGRMITSYPVDMETGESEVKHFKMFHPLDDYLGLSPIMPAAADIDQHNLSARHNVALLNNGARPSGALIFDPKDESGMSVQLSESQRQQILTDLELRFSGENNAGRAMLLEGDFKYVEMGLSPREMDFLQLKNMSARDIALCFGVPGQLVGIPDSQTYANMSEARLALYEETIIPLMKRVESDLNEWFKTDYDENITITYDYDQISAMTERRRMVYQNVIEAVREGIISRNEARERLDLEPIEGGDDVYINANLFPLGSAVVKDDITNPDEFEDADEDMNGRKYPDGTLIDPKLPDAYRLGNDEKNCGNCAYYQNGICTVWNNAKVRPEYLCAKWESAEESKAESDVDTTPTKAMAENASEGLELRKEYNRGGTMVGVARANQIVAGERLSPSTVRRTHSFFSRHEVDKEAPAFKRGHPDFPSAGYIAWQLWGGDEGQSWARRKVAELDREREERGDDLHSGDFESKAEVSEKMKKALAKKVEDHNEEHGDKRGKRVTQRMLEAVFRRGVGAYNTNPQSVRPSVTSSDQWALARVNVFLGAVRTGRYKSGQFDRDLLPKDHPLYREKGGSDD
tara:strand:- start:14451 stop:16628 length:2178 start_codon:yes stop_codon:yes gene_type:complete